MKIIMGRDFSEEFPSDSSAIIINERAVEVLGWEDPIGTEPVSRRPTGRRAAAVLCGHDTGKGRAVFNLGEKTKDLWKKGRSRDFAPYPGNRNDTSRQETNIHQRKTIKTRPNVSFSESLRGERI